MIPASFAPYIIKLVAPKLTEMVVNHVAKAFKLPQVVNYMELPNEADKGVEKLKEEVNMLKESLKSIEKDTHPPAIDLKEWAEVKDVIKKLQNMKKFKKLGK